MTDPHEAFTALCDSMRMEGGMNQGKANIVAIASGRDCTVTLRHFHDRCNLAWRDILQSVAKHYIDAWAGNGFDYERALVSLKDDIAELIAKHREEYGMDDGGDDE